MKIVGISEFRNKLFHYLDLVKDKNEIVKITSRNVEIARILPLKKNNKKTKKK